MDDFNPRTEVRPWGEFREFVLNEPVSVKILRVEAGESLSLQRHEKRTEFWRVLSGEPEITEGEKIISAKPGDEITIPAGTEHRLSAGSSLVEVLEISKGEFDENDEVRIEDKYGRI